MNIGEKLHGFAVTDKKYVKELGCDVYTLRHERCGARLVFIDREDDNMTFSIAFKTLPHDSTGVFHILEHSVLCGSDKYPVKDPFVELLKGSLNTFLNAMTFQDKTMYPVSSRNRRDFLNLVGIYMDAVLHPLAVKSPNAFYQEGWHYEIDEKSGALSYKGVVLNEMRGEYSSPESLEERHINAMLYEGTPYAEDSGGDPEEIVKLTYEDFCAAHAKYYHPSSAELFLDGAVVLDEVLPLLNEYLKDYEARDVSGEDFRIPVSSITAPLTRTAEYEVKSGESVENKTRVTLAYLVSRFDEPERNIAAGILLGTLFATNESPGKKALLDSGLCEDVAYTVHDGILETSVLFEFINVKDGGEEALLALFRDTVSAISKCGIDKSELMATLNATEFKIREKDYGSLPLGVVYAMISLESLLYSDDAIQNFKYEEPLAFLRDRVATDYYECLLSEMLLTNEKHATLIMHPSLTAAEKRLAKEAECLTSAAASLTNEEKRALVELNRELSRWQETEDSKEQLATIPTLSLSDIPTTVRKTPIEVCELDDVTAITHSIATAGIVYADFMFEITDIDKEDLPILSVLNILLGNLATKSHSATELQRIVKSELGGIDARMTALTDHGRLHLYWHVSASVLDSKRDELVRIVGEILNETVFDDTAAIKNILRQTVISSEESFASTGHQIAMGRVAAASSEEAAAREYYSGYEAYLALKHLDKSFESEKEGLRARFSELCTRFISRERLTLGITGECDEGYLRQLSSVFENRGKVGPVCNISTIPLCREGIEIPAQIAFAASGYSLGSLGLVPTGSYDVVRTLVGYEFLWSRIRVRGGAYGAGMVAGIGGNIGFYSYRDPSPEKSLECYLEVADFLRTFAKEGADVTKYIIGALGDADPVRTPRMAGTLSTGRYLRGISYEDSCEMRRALLSVDTAELLRIADVIEKCTERGAVCVVGSKDKLARIQLDKILKI